MHQSRLIDLTDKSKHEWYLAISKKTNSISINRIFEQKQTQTFDNLFVMFVSVAFSRNRTNF